MSTIRKTITLTDKQDAWIKSQIEKGDFTNDSEYLRALIRKDQAEQNAKRSLKDAIMEGLESGESTASLEDVWTEAKLRIDN